MRIVEVPAKAVGKKTVLRVIDAQWAGDYRVTVTFSDTAVRTVDFGPFLLRSRHPSVREYLAPERFAAFILRDGDLMWGDYDLIFPISDLYAGRIA